MFPVTTSFCACGVNTPGRSPAVHRAWAAVTICFLVKVGANLAVVLSDYLFATAASLFAVTASHGASSPNSPVTHLTINWALLVHALRFLFKIGAYCAVDRRVKNYMSFAFFAPHATLLVAIRPRGPSSDFTVDWARACIARRSLLERRAFLTAVFLRRQSFTLSDLHTKTTSYLAFFPSTPTAHFAMNSTLVSIAFTGVLEAWATAKRVVWGAHDTRACLGSTSTDFVTSTPVGPDTNNAIFRRFVRYPIHSPLGSLGNSRCWGFVKVHTETVLRTPVDGSTTGCEQVVGLATNRRHEMRFG